MPEGLPDLRHDAGQRRGHAATGTGRVGDGTPATTADAACRRGALGRARVGAGSTVRSGRRETRTEKDQQPDGSHDGCDQDDGAGLHGFRRTERLM